MPDAIRAAIFVPTSRHEVQGVVLARSQSTGVEPSRARDATRHIDRWLVHLVGWIYHIETYQSFVFGLALILFGAVIAATGRLRARSGTSRLSGLCYLAQGWIIGSSGFSSGLQIPTRLGIGLILMWTVWLLIAALRMNTAALTETTSDATT